MTKNTKDILGWGLIGASTIAREYMIPAINAQPNSHAIGVLSSDIERGRQYAVDNQLSYAYESLDEMLADPSIDAVFINTTNEKHKAQTLAAATAGKHVLCEKPLALDLLDAREMLQACRAANVIFGTNHHMRYAVTHRTLRRLIREGAIGRRLFARVFHAIYLPPDLQTWRLNNNVMEQEPIGEIYLQRGGDRKQIALGAQEDLYVQCLRHFNTAVYNQGSPLTTGEDGVKSLAIALAVRESAKTGQKIKVNYDGVK